MFKEVQQAHVQAAPNFGHNSRQPRSLVFDITEASARRLWDCSSASGEPMSSLAARWVGDSCKLDGPPSVCLALPIPHALLCCSSAWLSHAIPMPLGRTRQEKAIRRWVSAKRLFRLFQDVLADTSDDLDHLGPQWELSPDRLQRVADLMRLHILERRPLTEDDRDDCSFHVKWLQNIVDSLIRLSLRHSRQAYNMDTLVQCVLFSGFLRQAADCKHALLVGMRAVCTRIVTNTSQSASTTTVLCHPYPAFMFTGLLFTLAGACSARLGTQTR